VGTQDAGHGTRGIGAGGHRAQGCGDTGTMDTELWEHEAQSRGHTGPWGHTAMGTQGHGDTEPLGQRDMGTQGHMVTGIEGYGT